MLIENKTTEFKRECVEDNKAEEIIRKNNVSDPFVMVHNSPENTIPLQQTSVQILAENLNLLYSYLKGKLTVKLGQK